MNRFPTKDDFQFPSEFDGFSKELIRQWDQLFAFMGMVKWYEQNPWIEAVDH
ncbi:MAG: hypothetical protein V1799_05175 [bacterium]